MTTRSLLPRGDVATRTVYRQYDVQGVKEAYDAPGSIPDELRNHYVSAYAAWSERVRNTAHARLDLPYGSGPAQRLDLFPTPRANAPALVYLHGGGWEFGSKDARVFPAAEVTAAGVAWISVGYTLAPKGTVAQMVDEARMAVAWVYEHAHSFGIDRQKIVVAGNSAGAHLAAMTLTADWDEYGCPPNVVHGACLVSGIYDFEPMTWSRFEDPAALGTHTEGPGDPLHRRLSPIAQLPPRACRPVIAVGSEEPYEFRRQAIDYYDVLRKSGCDPQLLVAPGHDHFSIIGEWGRRESGLLRAALALAEGPPRPT